MENINLIDSFAEFKEFKNIDRATLMRVLEDVFRNMLVKKYGTDENFDIIINIDKGDLEIWRNRTVVEDDKLVNPNQEIALRISGGVPCWRCARICPRGYWNWRRIIFTISIRTKSVRLSWGRFIRFGSGRC